MSMRAGAILLASGAALLCGCGPKTPTRTVNESMTKVMSPQAQTIWDITSGAFNAKGDGLEAPKISPAQWAQLERAGQLVKDWARLLADTPHVTAAAADQAILGAYAAPPGAVKQTWDAANARQVQALIDANPALFSKRAKLLAEAGDTLVKASRAKDVQSLYRVSSGLDEVCDGCHQRFWGTDDPPPFPRQPPGLKLAKP